MSRFSPLYLCILFSLSLQEGWCRGGGRGESPSASAGVLEKQIEGEFSIRELPGDKPLPLLEIDIPKEQLHIAEGLSVYIEHIHLQGNTLLPEKKIQQLLHSYEQKKLSGKEVLHLCMELECLYVEKGYILAWVYPPVQTIEQDTLYLQVVEGTLHQIHIEGNTSYTTSYLYRYVSSLQGKPLNYNQLIQALTLMNENIDCWAEGVLKKSSLTGCVDLLIRVQDQFPAHVNAGYNNWGSNNTSYSQLTSEMDLGNLAMNGDLFTLMTSTGVPPSVMYYLNPQYSIPLGGSGSRCNLYYLFTHSTIQQDKPLALSCWAEVGAVSFIRPIRRSPHFDLDISTGFSVKQYKNFSKGITVSYDKLRVLSLGCNLDHLDCFRGRTLASAYVNVGLPYLFNGSAPIDPQCSRVGAGGRYYILNLGLQRVQTFPGSISLMITSSAQGTFNKLPLGEQFVIGGASTVRGYPSCIAVGDTGYCVSAELYSPIPGIQNRPCQFCKKSWKDALQILAFLDHGGVYTNSEVALELSPSYLTSVGAGLRFYGPRNLNVSFDAAFPLTNQYKLFNSMLYVRITMDFL